MIIFDRQIVTCSLALDLTLISSMMSPAATSTAAPAKSGEFDTATLFVADKSARDEASLALTAAAKKSGVEFFGTIGLNDALVKVCPFVVATRLKICLANIIPLYMLTTRP